MIRNPLRVQKLSGRPAAWPSRVRRGSFFSVDDLQSAIRDFLNAWNEDPKPFAWTTTVESIQTKLARCRQTLEQVHTGCTKPRTRKMANGLSS
jgi:hypothetical protein